MEAINNEICVKFLLGQVTSEERDSIEEQFFSDTRSFDDLLIAENDLTDAYAADRLSREERSLFEKRLRITSHQRQRIDFAKTLLTYVRNLSVNEIETEASIPHGNWLANQFAFNP